MTTFRAKARAVELLGKGQIADLPTAITELWKNGYDAYAKNLSCSLYLETYKDNTAPIFLLSDDGFGMSEDDILTKWFVLGTDSKARGEKSQPHFGLKQRPPMGEKGIGRLSVAYLGSQMLMLTKKEGMKANGVLMDWRILENYDFYLSDLNIPTFLFSSTQDFLKQFSLGKEQFQNNLDINFWKEQSLIRNSILNDLAGLNIPGFVIDEIINNFCRSDYHGTAFLIFSPIESLTIVSDKDRVEFKNNRALNYIKASLSGLHNDLKNLIRDFETHFYVLDSGGRYDAINEFFTQDEMRHADHWLKGEFDETGFFSGELRVFNKRVKYTFRPNRPPGITSYGSFKIECGSFEGAQSASILNEEQYLSVNEKLKTFGGLYIYRDDFRVLPYGRTEADFLEFEKRRNLGAGYYFFSHRKMIGYIDITRKGNAELKDKAGREGFIQNKAFREFKDDLTAFFVDISVRYMRIAPDGEETLRQSQIDEIKDKFEKQNKAAKKKNNVTKKAFIEQLIENKKQIVSLHQEIEVLEHSLAKESNTLQINYNNYNGLIKVLEEKRLSVRELKINKPRGISISKKQEDEFLSYQNEYYKTEDKVRACTQIVSDTRSRLNVENLKLEFNEKFRAHLKNLEKSFFDFQNKSKESYSRIQKLLNDEKESQINHFIERTEYIKLLENDNKDEIASKIFSLESFTSEQNISIDNSIKGFIKHLENLQIDVDDDFLRGWYQEQNENLQKKLSDYEELAQLGISIEIIDHQFNVMYSQMNDAIAEFDRFSKIYPEMGGSYNQLNSAFQHLEGNYKLLKPLYRTSRRTRETITGAQLEKYIREFFANEFERYQIHFSVNEPFKSEEFFTYDSIIKPVFLNLINNANYWLISVANRRIRIESQGDKILVMNSGELIDSSYLDDIFTLFFTRKRDGRGIGLYLAKKNLNSIDYDICATNEKELNKLKGACFVITKLNTI
jgi:hypothetical protein